MPYGADGWMSVADVRRANDAWFDAPSDYRINGCFGRFSWDICEGDLTETAVTEEWFNDNDVTAIRWHDLVDDYLTAYEFSGISAAAFARTVSEDVIWLSDLHEEERLLAWFKSEEMRDAFGAACIDAERARATTSYEGPCWALSNAFFEYRAHGPKFIVIRINGYQDYMRRRQEIMSFEPGGINVMAALMEDRGGPDSITHLMVGPFQTADDALIYKLSMPY